MRWAMIPLVLAAAPADARVSLGQFGHWGAFRDGDRCYAIAEPVSERRGGRPSAAFVAPPGRRPQLHVRLSREAGSARPPALSLGGRRVVLAGGGVDFWARDARDDAAIVAAARGGERLAIEAIDRRGRRFRDLYPLAGAASAIDAALLGCLSVSKG